MHSSIAASIRAMQTQSPLVHNITNLVVMQVTANALLAAGASPIMAHAPEELDELLSLASALVLNIGTLDKTWIASMEQAGTLALAKGVPVVLDPVGAGASRLRTNTALRLLSAVHPAVLRGNASEIMAMASSHSVGAKGVDSRNSSDEALDAALALARDFGCVVSVSGEIDLITDGSRLLRVHGGSPLMTRVTGLGCSSTAITAAVTATASSPIIGAAAGMAVMAEAGSEAAASAHGPGSFLPLFLDALSHLNPEAAASRVDEH